MNALWNFIFEFAVILKQFYYQEYLYKLLFLNEENILGKNLLHSLPADSIFYSFYFHTEPIKKPSKYYLAPRNFVYLSTLPTIKCLSEREDERSRESK